MKLKNKLLTLSLLGVFTLISTVIISLLFYFNIFDNSSNSNLVVSMYNYSSIEEAFKDNNWFGMYLTIGIGCAILLLIILIIIFVCAYKSKKKRIERSKKTSTRPLNENIESNFLINYPQVNNQHQIQPQANNEVRPPVQKGTVNKTTTVTTKKQTPPTRGATTKTTTTKKVVKKSSLGTNNRK